CRPHRTTAFPCTTLFRSSALIGFALLPIFVWLVLRFATSSDGLTGAWALAAFHTLFHALGAAVVLPGVSRFSKVVTRLIRDRHRSEEHTSELQSRENLVC